MRLEHFPHCLLSESLELSEDSIFGPDPEEQLSVHQSLRSWTIWYSSQAAQVHLRHSEASAASQFWGIKESGRCSKAQQCPCPPFFLPAWCTSQRRPDMPSCYYLPSWRSPSSEDSPGFRSYLCREFRTRISSAWPGFLFVASGTFAWVGGCCSLSGSLRSSSQALRPVCLIVTFFRRLIISTSRSYPQVPWTTDFFGFLAPPFLVGRKWILERALRAPCAGEWASFSDLSSACPSQTPALRDLWSYRHT